MLLFSRVKSCWEKNPLLKLSKVMFSFSDTFLTIDIRGKLRKQYI